MLNHHPLHLTLSCCLPVGAKALFDSGIIVTELERECKCLLLSEQMKNTTVILTLSGPC